jgi:hypothetical protein
LFTQPYVSRKVCCDDHHARRLTVKLTNFFPVLALVAPLVLLSACADDDGADTREAGSVVIIGPPPPGGGASVSAIGTGCTTRGATTKLAANTIQIDIDEYEVIAPATVPAGVNRIVVRNFGSDPHEIVITQAGSVDDLPVVDGFVDVDALAGQTYRVTEFAGNTICEGTFDLPAGDYVAFSNLDGPRGSDYAQGMVATFVVA